MAGFDSTATEVWAPLRKLPPATGWHLALGIFDGVHLGHQRVVGEAARAAHAAGERLAVLTFDPHPSRLMRPAQPTLLLQPLAQKVERLRQAGADAVVVVPFTAALAAIAAEDFPRHLQAVVPHLRHLWAGDNFRYGRGRVGDMARLTRDAAALGLAVTTVARLPSRDGQMISSSRIRQLLAEGQVGAANALLGYAYTATGTIAAGRRLGRTLGFPTLNLPWAPELVPALGVYRVRFQCGAQRWWGVANYGRRPTVENPATAALMLETHLLGAEAGPWPGPGDTVAVEWLDFLRPEQKFAGLDALRTQIAVDVAEAKRRVAAELTDAGNRGDLTTPNAP